MNETFWLILGFGFAVVGAYMGAFYLATRYRDRSQPGEGGRNKP